MPRLFKSLLFILTPSSMVLAQLLNFQAPTCAISCISTYLSTTPCKQNLPCICTDTSLAALALANCVFGPLSSCTPFELTVFSEDLAQLCPELLTATGKPPMPNVDPTTLVYASSMMTAGGGSGSGNLSGWGTTTSAAGGGVGTSVGTLLGTGTKGSESGNVVATGEASTSASVAASATSSKSSSAAGLRLDCGKTFVIGVGLVLAKL